MGIGYMGAASPWLVGGTTLIDQRPEPYQALLYPGITHAMLVPTVLSAILSAPANAFPRNEALQLAVGGGAMTQTQAEDAKARITIDGGFISRHELEHALGGKARGRHGADDLGLFSAPGAPRGGSWV